jgi:P4 family phage/plasmid primase-like protien
MEHLELFPKIPVVAGTKRPALSKWQKIPKEELKDMPQGNYAIRCDDIVVVDVDNKPENEVKATLDMDDVTERVFATNTFVVKSKSGNPHAYFLLDERMTCWKKRIGLFGFMDVCMGNTGLVIGPGSIVDGKEYTIYNTTAIQRMPNWLFKQIDTQMQQLAKADKEQQPDENATFDEDETDEDLMDMLIAAGYESPALRKNAYNGYDIVFDGHHVCPITEHEHDHIDGFLFKTPNGNIMTGCYSHHCKGHYKTIKSNSYAEDIDKLIDRAAGSSGAHYDVAFVVKEMLGNQVKYIDDKLWYVWNPDTGLWFEDRGGKHIRIELSTTVCSAFAKRIIYWNEQARIDEDLRETYEEKAKKLLHICEKLKDNYYKNSIVRECESLLADTTILELLNENTNVISFNNGVFDFTTLQFRKGRPDDYISMTVGYDFPDAVPPKVLKEVKQIFQDPFDSQDMTSYMLSVLASCMDGRRKFQEFYIWTGRGSNGKSTIQELVMQTFGDYAKPLDIAFWTKAKRECGGAMPELADKKGVRFVFSNEPEATDKIQVSKIKEVTGGERITARKLYAQPVTYRPQFGIFILCNDLPELSKHDGGIERRTRVLSFVHQFRQNPLQGQRRADPLIMDNCRNNMEWRKACIKILIDQYIAIRQLHTLHLPNEVVEASRSYMEENNPVGLWLREHFEITNDDSDRILADDMWNMYKSMVDRNCGKVTFSRAMTETNGMAKKMYKTGRTTRMYYIGIKNLAMDQNDSIEV